MSWRSCDWCTKHIRRSHTSWVARLKRPRSRTCAQRQLRSTSGSTKIVLIRSLRISNLEAKLFSVTVFFLLLVLSTWDRSHLRKEKTSGSSWNNILSKRHLSASTTYGKISSLRKVIRNHTEISSGMYSKTLALRRSSRWTICLLFSLRTTLQSISSRSCLRHPFQWLQTPLASCKSLSSEHLCRTCPNRRLPDRTSLPMRRSKMRSNLAACLL